MRILVTFITAVTALLFAACSSASAAGSPWRFQLDSENSCSFTMTHQTVNATARFKGAFKYCDAVVDVIHREVAKDIAIVDAPEERGGYVYVIRAYKGAIRTLLLNYRSADEDGLVTKLQGNVLTIHTSQQEIKVSMESDGSMKRLPPRGRR